MADPIRSGARWLRERWQRSSSQPESRPGVEALLETGRALDALECSICEDVAGSPGLGARASFAAPRASTAAATRNAFGRPLRRELGAADRGSVARATGMTLAGLRATAFLDGHALASLQEELCAAADRLAPLVLHAELGGSGHADYHRVADAGLFQALATSGQEALDLTLVAHWLAERALLPGLVATDGGTFERLHLPDDELVRSCLGPPDEPLPCPTEGQRLLFGAERPRLLPWFDPERPVATGGLRGAADEARARLGRALFFRDHLPELAQLGMQEVARLTGRPLSSIGRYQLEDAEVVLVGQGAGVQALRAVADALRRTRRWKVGVLGITWLRPFPSAAVAEALEGRRTVAVVEVLDEPLASRAPLAREIESASDGRVFYQTTEEVIALGALDGKEVWRVKRPADLNRRAWASPTLAVHGDHGHHDSIVGETPTVTQHGEIDFVQRGVDEHLADVNAIHDRYGCGRHGDHVSGVGELDVRRVDPDVGREPRMRRQLPVLAVDRNEESRPHEPQKLSQLVRGGVTGDMHRSVGGRHDLRSAAEHVIDHAGDALFVSRNDTPRVDHQVAGGYFRLAVFADRDARQSGHGLALRPAGHDEDPLRRHVR